ncbi:hypothetical protein EDC04DRAFT_2616534 [Pisolithus marmoratus]|nr:hypothetical protein EDC04DRAFT_2616534 [Pisolithus marmoratus]
MPVQLPSIHLPNIPLPPQPADPPNLQDIHQARLFCERVENRVRFRATDVLAHEAATNDDAANAHLYFHRVVAAANQGQAGPADPQHFIQQVVQQLNNINQQFDAVDKRFNAIDQRFNAIGERFNAIDQRFNAIDQRFNVIDQKFDAMNQQFNNVNDHLGRVDDRLNRMERGQIDMTEILYKTYNQGCADGTECQYKVIPFHLPNGGTELPQMVGLPALRDAQSIVNLTDAELNLYLNRYGIPRVGNLRRETKLRRLTVFLGIPWPLR